MTMGSQADPGTASDGQSLATPPREVARYALIGNPVAQSKSPLIHTAFAAQTAQPIAFELLLAPLDGFEGAVRGFFAGGGQGLNVTAPFKLQACALAQHLSARAAAAGAVNTLWMRDGRMHGDNTDGAGMVRDIEANLGFALRARRILLLGAGGAARGVMRPLLDENPALLVVANRTLAKARELAQRFAVESAGLVELAGRHFDLVINATSAGMRDEAIELPGGLYAADALAYDMVYAVAGGGRTTFLRLAADQGATRLADGLGMLVEQAAEAFHIWRGVRPDTAPVLAELRAAVGA